MKKNRKINILISLIILIMIILSNVIVKATDETIISKDNKINQWQIFKKNCIAFIAKLGLAERFNEFISPKSVKKELKQKQEQINRQKQDRLSYSQEKHYKQEQAEI